jgi:hypothetical protein
VVIEISIKYPGGRTRIRGTDLTTLEGAKIIPGKHSDTRIKPLPLPTTTAVRDPHNRYFTPERKPLSV